MNVEVGFAWESPLQKDVLLRDEVIPMNIILVQKIRENGEPCAKSARVLSELAELGLISRIDQIITADERDPESMGYLLAKTYQIEAAPFFLVDKDDGSREIYTAYHRFMREVFQHQTSEANEISEIMAQNPDLDFI
ncbi:MAG: hypothetical protein ACFB4J_05105 [Elainellaceae cyanobacterium]